MITGVKTHIPLYSGYPEAKNHREGCLVDILYPDISRLPDHHGRGEDKSYHQTSRRDFSSSGFFKPNIARIILNADEIKGGLLCILHKSIHNIRNQHKSSY